VTTGRFLCDLQVFRRATLCRGRYCGCDEVEASFANKILIVAKKMKDHYEVVLLII